MRRTPIRARLTAWYVLVLAIVLSALGAFVVTRLRSDLTSELDRSLRSAAGQIAVGYRTGGSAEFADTALTVLPGPGNRESGAQILSPSGRVLHTVGDPVARLPLADRATLARALAGGRVVSSRHLGAPAQHLRTLAIRVTREGRDEALVVAELLQEVDHSVHQVLVLLLVGGAGGLVLVALGGWWIARKALRPVEQMTRRADGIDIDDLSQRIVEPRARDELAHLARTLNLMLDRLEHGVEARQRLIADASHELRAPLAAMRSELEVSLRQDPLDDQARAVLESAREEVLRMGRIVADLLTLARLDEGRLELLVSPQELHDIAARAVRVHRAAAAAAGVAVAVEGRSLVVQGDRDRLEQVVSNLVENAVHFAPAGGAVTVSLWQEGSEARIGVSDDGPGVPAEARERVFERFSREDPARARTGGAGLGLAICREIVNAHGGRIWVQDHAPRGSTFVVALPWADAGSPARKPTILVP